MKTDKPFILLVRARCHLCEAAEQLLAQSAVAYCCLDVDSYLALQHEYGLLVPVLIHTATHRELIWPFDAAALHEFVATNL